MTTIFKKSKNIELLSFDKKSKTNYWMNILFFKKLNFQKTYDLSLSLAKKKIETRRLWRPLNLQLHLKKFENTLLFVYAYYRKI